jgi:hypothetical protein
LLCASAAHGQTQASEADLKSAFLYKFIHYAEWPHEALGASASPIAICVMGQDPLAQVLEAAVSGRTSHERPVVVRRIASPVRSAGATCCSSARRTLRTTEQVVAQVSARPILTVGDAEGFARRGGMINFTRAGRAWVSRSTAALCAAPDSISARSCSSWRSWSGRERRPVTSMRSFRNTPIKQKLIAISLLSSAGRAAAGLRRLHRYELRAYREATLNQLTSVAGVIAANSSSALSFDDPESAEHTLTALRSERMVVAACIYGPDERIFAAYYKDLKQERCAPRRSTEIEESRDGLDVSMPIVAEGEDALGVIVIRSRPIDLYERLARYGGILGLVMLFSGLASWPLASKLQRFISDPILQLVETSRRVSADKDFSLRAVSKGEDEVGVLVESFNQMLEQIEDRDQALSRHRENLEAEVERRTGELRAVNAKLTREISQREQAEDRIRDLAYYDGLTGLPNRSCSRSGCAARWPGRNGATSAWASCSSTWTGSSR